MRPQEGKISLRALDLDRIPDKKIVFETLMLHLNVPLIGLKPTKIGYLAITEHQNEIDKILDRKGKEKLSSIGLEARLPIKLKAERSIICRKIDSSVGEMTKEQLKSEINQKNRQIEVVEITKFGSYTHLFKIELQTIEQAQHVLQNGFLCFNTKIASHQLEKEEFTDILICFNCYQLEEHTSTNCPNKETIVCSECTGNHNFKDCRAEFKKCLNCGGPHRTMAMACPKKKEIIRKKRNMAKQKEQDQKEQTYARVAEKTIEKINKQTKRTEETQTALESIGLTAVIMIMDAHIHNIIEPGSYSSRLNQTLAKNNIQPIELETPQSEKLLDHQIIGETIQAMSEREEKLDRLKKIGKHLGAESDSSDEESTDEMPHASIEAKEFQTKIFALETKVPNRTLNPSSIKTYFKLGHIKYQIASPNISADHIESLINQEKLYSKKDNTAFLPESEYKKIRNGHSNRSPPEKQPVKKKSKK